MNACLVIVLCDSVLLCVRNRAEKFRTLSFGFRMCVWEIVLPNTRSTTTQSHLHAQSLHINTTPCTPHTITTHSAPNIANNCNSTCSSFDDEIHNKRRLDRARRPVRYCSVDRLRCADTNVAVSADPRSVADVANKFTGRVPVRARLYARIACLHPYSCARVVNKVARSRRPRRAT